MFSRAAGLTLILIVRRPLAVTPALSRPLLGTGKVGEPLQKVFLLSSSSDFSMAGFMSSQGSMSSSFAPTFAVCQVGQSSLSPCSAPILELCPVHNPEFLLLGARPTATPSNLWTHRVLSILTCCACTASAFCGSLSHSHGKLAVLFQSEIKASRERCGRQL